MEVCLLLPGGHWLPSKFQKLEKPNRRPHIMHVHTQDSKEGGLLSAAESLQPNVFLNALRDFDVPFDK